MSLLQFSVPPALGMVPLNIFELPEKVTKVDAKAQSCQQHTQEFSNSHLPLGTAVGAAETHSKALL